MKNVKIQISNFFLGQRHAGGKLITLEGIRGQKCPWPKTAVKTYQMNIFYLLFWLKSFNQLQFFNYFNHLNANLITWCQGKMTIIPIFLENETLKSRNAWLYCVMTEKKNVVIMELCLLTPSKSSKFRIWHCNRKKKQFIKLNLITNLMYI